MGSRKVTLSLEVEIDDESDTGVPLQGRIQRDEEPATTFSGWLGLLTALDQLLSGPTGVPLSAQSAHSAQSARSAESAEPADPREP